MCWLRKIRQQASDGWFALMNLACPAANWQTSDSAYHVEFHDRALAWSFRRLGKVTYGSCRRLEVQASLSMAGAAVRERKCVRIIGVTVEGQNDDDRQAAGDGTLTVCYPHPLDNKPVVADFVFGQLGYCPDLAVRPGHRADAYTFSSHPQRAYA